MTKHDIINELYKDKEICSIMKAIIFNSNKSKDFQDIFNEIFLILLEKPETLIQELYESKMIKYYIIKILTNQIKSSTSSYHKNYQKHSKHKAIIPDNYLENIEENIEEYNTYLNPNYEGPVTNQELYDYAIKNKLLNWFETEIFTLYYAVNRIDEKMNYTNIQKEYGITISTIHRTIKEIQKKIKNHLC